MNFLAHAVVASWQSEDPAFLFGAMLPDFASMGRARLRHVEHPRVAGGVALHHATDRVFHASPLFLSLLRDATETLRDAGLERGSARGAAHVGVELLLDGALLRDAGVAELYASGMSAAVDPDVDRTLVWSDPGGASRWRSVRSRLGASDMPPAYGDPGRVAQGVIRALDPRPRLALDPEGRTAVVAWVAAARPAVDAASALLLAQVRDGLAGSDRMDI